MKTKLYPLGAAIAAILFLFVSCDQSSQSQVHEEHVKEAKQQIEREYANALQEAGGDPTKAKDIIQRKSLERKLASVTTYATASGQKIHYFPTQGRDFQDMILAYSALHPDERIVSFAGDSEGDKYMNYSQGNVSRHNGYHVVTEKVKPRE